MGFFPPFDAINFLIVKQCMENSSCLAMEGFGSWSETFLFILSLTSTLVEVMWFQGNGSELTAETPQQLTTLFSVKSIACGGNHSVAIAGQLSLF